MYRTVARIVALTGLCVGAIACAKAPAVPVDVAPLPAPAEAQVEAPVPVKAEAPAPGIPLAAPVVQAIRAGAAVGDLTLDAEAEAPLTGEDVLTVPERGMAVVRWSEGPRAESLGAALTLLGAADVRQLGVVQRTGTARYSVPPADDDGAISLVVETSRGTVRALSGPADVIVSLDPAAPLDPLAPANPAAAAAAATLWIVVINGAVEVTADQSVASAAGAVGAAAPLTVALAPGQAVAIGPSAVGATAMPVELSGIETWYGGLVAGDGPPSVTTAAYRCQVLAPRVELREQPSTTAKTVARSVALQTGALIDVRGRSKDGTWLQAFLSASELTGWVPSADLQCIAPAEVLRVVDPATVQNIDRTALVAKVPEAAFFIQDKTEIAPGGCAKLNWDVVSGTQVTFDGQSVPGKGFKVMCPDSTTSHTLTWTDEAGRPQTRRLTITVSAAIAAAAAAAGNDGGGGRNGAAGGAPAAGGPTATPCIGPECEVTVPPPLATATRRPRPTTAPVQPTDAPPAEPTDAPPPPSNPTAPPGAEPTDRPADPTGTPTATPFPTPSEPEPEPTATPTPGSSETPEPPTASPPPSETPTPETTPTP